MTNEQKFMVVAMIGERQIAILLTHPLTEADANTHLNDFHRSLQQAGRSEEAALAWREPPQQNGAFNGAYTFVSMNNLDLPRSVFPTYSSLLALGAIPLN